MRKTNGKKRLRPKGFVKSDRARDFVGVKKNCPSKPTALDLALALAELENATTALIRAKTLLQGHNKDSDGRNS